MTPQHDWFAECAENYIAYLFSQVEDFRVFGAGKWEADIAVCDKKTNKWIKIEVRSTDRKKKPTRKSAQKLKDKADMLAEVNLEKNTINVKLNKLVDGKKSDHKNSLKNPIDGNQLEEWVRRHF